MLFKIKVHSYTECYNIVSSAKTEEIVLLFAVGLDEGGEETHPAIAGLQLHLTHPQLFGCFRPGRNFLPAQHDELVALLQGLADARRVGGPCCTHPAADFIWNAVYPAGGDFAPVARILDVCRPSPLQREGD